MHNRPFKAHKLIEDVAIQRVSSISPDLLKHMNAYRPNEVYEKAHGYPVTVPQKWRPTDDRIIDWSVKMEKSLRLYVHIPWCLTKCIFCPYESKPDEPGDQEFHTYLNCLKKELETYCNKLGLGRLLAETLYIGGGTPSVLSPKRIESLFKIIHRFIEFQGEASLITEVSPGSLTSEKVRAFIDGGITRVSVGVQSFRDHILRICRRDHDADKAENAYRLLRAANIREINFDLMLALPGQTPDDFIYSVEKALQLAPSSISFIDLCVVKGSKLYEEGNYYPSWEDNILMRGIYQEILRRDGRYVRSRPHYYILPEEARGRTTRTPYLDSRRGPGFQIGIGVTACSHLGDVVYRNSRNPEYRKRLGINKLPVKSGLLLSEGDKIAMIVIRTIVDNKLVPDVPEVLLRYKEQINFLANNRLMDDKYNLTDNGCLFYDEILYMFYPRLKRN